MVKRIGVGFGGIVAAVAVSLAAVPAAGADTINVVQKTRYWWDNATYYEYGPFRDANHCIGFAIRSCRNCSWSMKRCRHRFAVAFECSDQHSVADAPWVAPPLRVGPGGRR